MDQDLVVVNGPGETALAFVYPGHVQKEGVSRPH
jgi:hypothetical protein